LRADLGEVAAERIEGEAERIADLRRAGQAAKIVVGVADVRLAARQVLQGRPVEIVVGEGDRLGIAQAAAGDVAVGVIAELLIVGRAAGVGALGGQRVAGLRQAVEAVIFVSGEVVLTVLQRLEERRKSAWRRARKSAGRVSEKSVLYGDCHRNSCHRNSVITILAFWL
jgi:hypothetical protein